LLTGKHEQFIPNRCKMPQTKVTVPSTDKLYFRQATPGERVLCWKRNHVSWGRILSDIDHYIGRELLNGTAPLNQNGGITYWILSTLEEPPIEGEEDESTILAACESLRKRSLVLTKAGIEEGYHGYGVASVYTNPACRGQGVARILMERLGKWFDEVGARFSVLFSDVGRVSRMLL
jgi:GNAT superfamily N-acetyltransferase